MAQVRGVSRVLAKLEASINEGRYYEAHQMYRTLHFRYLGQKKYDELIDLLHNGSTLLLSRSQQTSGADLAMLMLEVFETSKSTPNESNIAKITELFRLLGYRERQQYIIRAVKWSVGEESQLGDPSLHQQLALVLWQEKQYTSARYHFLRSNDGTGCATLLIELHQLKGYPSEVDLFVTQAVLQYLCLQKQVVAYKLFEAYTCKHPDISKKLPGPPYILPLLNFLWFLLLAVKKGRVAEFTVLLEQYRPSLARDPSYKEYLSTIGQIFFKMPPPQRQQGSVFGNLIQGLLGGLTEEEDESGPSMAAEDID